MNVAFVNRSLGMRRGGGEIWDLEMARALQSKGVDVTIYTGKPLTGDVEKPFELPVTKVPSPFLYDLGYAAPIGVGGVITDLDRTLFSVQLLRHLDDDHDIVHLNGYPELLRIKSNVDIPVTIKLNGPPHSLFYDYVHPWKSSYSWLQQADAVIATGVTTEAVQAETGIDVTTINPGVDAERFTPDGPARETSGPTVLWVGRFVPAKDLPVLIEAFAAVKSDRPNAELWLVGEGPRKERIERLVEKRGLRDAVEFWGYVANENLPPFYRAADVFALSSKTENHPIALMEAMSSSTPAVAPEVGWIPEMMDETTGGALVPPEDAKALASAMGQILDRSQNIDDYARRRATDEFSWDGRAEELHSLFERALAV